MRLVKAEVRDRSYPLTMNLYTNMDEHRDILTNGFEKPLAIGKFGFGIDMYDEWDDEKVKAILEHAFEICDEDKSPQCLFEYNGMNYHSLIISYENDAKNFDEKLDWFFDILSDGIIVLSNKENFRKKVTSIQISYPESWCIEYER